MPKKRQGMVMPIEAREAWGRTLYHEKHIAHFHSEQTTIEENGVTIRAISSPNGTDNYHYMRGFIGAVKKAEHFIYDKETGLDQIIMTPIVE
jgi:hypothetical protein